MELKSETYKGYEILFKKSDVNINGIYAIVPQENGTDWETKAPTKQEAFDYMKNLIDFMIENKKDKYNSNLDLAIKEYENAVWELDGITLNKGKTAKYRKNAVKLFSEGKITEMLDSLDDMLWDLSNGNPYKSVNIAVIRKNAVKKLNGK